MDQSAPQTKKKHNQKVIIKLIEDKLHIKVISENPDLQVSSWQTQIQSLSQCAEILSNFFNDLADFGQHIQDPNNIKVDYICGLISVLLKTTIKNKQSLAQIARIKLNPTKLLDLQKLNLSDISLFCEGQQYLTNKMIKYFFKTVVDHISDLKFDQMFDPIIHKFKVVGQNTQTIQKKLGGVLQQIDRQKKQIADIQHHIQGSFCQLKDYIETVKEGIDRQIIRCQNKYEVISLDVKDGMDKIRDDIRKQEVDLGWLKTNIKQIQQQIENIYTYLQMFGKKPIKRIEQIGLQLIDKTLPFFNHFKLENKIIVKKTQTYGYSTMLIGKQQLGKNQIFSIKIHKLGMYPLYIGALDSKHKLQQYCQQKDNRIWLSSQGVLFNGESQRMANQKFGTGSIIQVIVNIIEGEIFWKVGDKKIALGSKLLKNKDIKWLPCIWVGQVGDAVQVKN